jgi:hydroxymethylglutaryl-CoA lyase
MSAERTQILISEVGPRDGLQSIKPIMPLDAKKAWIDALVDAGITEIEVGSFVPAKLLPQLADTAEVVAHARTHPGLTVAVLVPNARGAENALAAGAHKLTLPLSASETHSLKNLRQTHAQVLEQAAQIAAMCKAAPYKVHFEGSVSTAFGCTIEGIVPEAKVVELAEKLMAAGCDEVGLSDTTGYGNPAQVKSVVKAVHAAIGAEHLTGLHLHNTRGLGLANVLAGLEVGITTFDGSLAGLGGCPFAPGASGNIVTEDLVFMLEAMGYSTGVNLDKLLKVRDILAAALPGEPLYGFTPDAGLPLGFAQAA